MARTNRIRHGELLHLLESPPFFELNGMKFTVSPGFLNFDMGDLFKYTLGQFFFHLYCCFGFFIDCYDYIKQKEVVKSTKTNSDIYYQLLSSNLKYVLEHLSDLSPHIYLVV